MRISRDDNGRVSVMSDHEHTSPWAQDQSEVKCPRCGSKNVSRMAESWAMSRGIQIYLCASCGKKFYDRGFDSYEPTYNE